MTLNINPSILSEVNLPPIKASGNILTYDKSSACGSYELNIFSTGELILLDYAEIKGGLEIYTPVLTICKALMYEELIIKNGLTIPLCFEGKGLIELLPIYESNNCFCWEFPESIKNKMMSILSLKPEYTTNDLKELLNIHRVTLPELGEVIDYDIPGVIDNLNNQDRIKFHVLKSKIIGIRSEQMVHNWLVGVLEYQSKPCGVFLNAYWDEYTNYPLRYILNAYVFKDMITYIKSLLFSPQDFEGMEIYDTNHDANTLKFKLNTNYTMLLDTPLNKEELTQMDINISKFLSLYTSYKNV